MNETLSTIIVAVCGLIGTAIGSFSGMKLMSYRIEQLEKGLENHNTTVKDLVARVYNLERKDALQDEQIAEIKNDLKQRS